MIESVIILALLSLLIATDLEPAEPVSSHRPRRRSFTSKAPADQTEN